MAKCKFKGTDPLHFKTYDCTAAAKTDDGYCKRHEFSLNRTLDLIKRVGELEAAMTNYDQLINGLRDLVCDLSDEGGEGYAREKLTALLDKEAIAMGEQRICPLCNKTYYDDCRCSEIMYADKITELEATIERLCEVAGYAVEDWREQKDG